MSEYDPHSGAPLRRPPSLDLGDTTYPGYSGGGADPSEHPDFGDPGSVAFPDQPPDPFDPLGHLPPIDPHDPNLLGPTTGHLPGSVGLNPHGLQGTPTGWSGLSPSLLTGPPTRGPPAGLLAELKWALAYFLKHEREPPGWVFPFKIPDPPDIPPPPPPAYSTPVFFLDGGKKPERWSWAQLVIKLINEFLARRHRVPEDWPPIFDPFGPHSSGSIPGNPSASGLVGGTGSVAGGTVSFGVKPSTTRLKIGFVLNLGGIYVTGVFEKKLDGDDATTLFGSISFDF